MSITTLIGNGDSTCRSVSGQDRTGPLGGVPWGVGFNSEGTLHFSVLDQGYIGRLNLDGTITHVLTGLRSPMTFAFDEKDNLYVAEYDGNRITYLSTSGQIEYLLNGILKNPMSARFDREKSPYLFVTDTGHHRILMYSLGSGVVISVAGTGEPGFQIPPLPAVESPLFFPIDVEVVGQLLFIADGMNNRLRLVNLGNFPMKWRYAVVHPEEMVTIVGYGERCVESISALDPCPTEFSGDGQLGCQAEINWPFSPRLDKKGNLWFIDANNHRVRVIEKSGKIYTVAGNSPLPATRGFRPPDSPARVGDNGPPRLAWLNRPMGICVAPKESGIVIADTDNYRIRYVKVSGI